MASFWLWPALWWQRCGRKGGFGLVFYPQLTTILHIFYLLLVVQDELM